MLKSWTLTRSPRPKIWPGWLSANDRQGVTPRLLQRYNDDVLTSKCVATSPIRICPCVGCTSSCARAVTWQYCLRTPAPASSEAT